MNKPITLKHVLITLAIIAILFYLWTNYQSKKIGQPPVFKDKSISGIKVE